MASTPAEKFDGFGHRADERVSSVHAPNTGAHGVAADPIGAALSEVIDASANINPLGPPAWLRQEIERSISALACPTDPDCVALRRAIAARHDASIEQVVVANGSPPLLAWLPFVSDATRWIVPVPSHGEYRRSAALAGRELLTLDYGPAPNFLLDWEALENKLADSANRATLVILGHPNNPTGALLDVARFERLRSRHPCVLFVVDEAFADFCHDFQSTWRPEVSNLMVLRSLSNILAIDGLPLGYALAPRSLSEHLRQRLLPGSVNLLAQRVGLRAFEDTDFAATTRAAIALLKSELLRDLQDLAGCRPIPSAANWILVELAPGPPTAHDVAEICRKQNVLLRVCDDFAGLSGQWVRISVRSAEENQRLFRVLAGALGRVTPKTKKRSPRAIMLQGCSSDAGKSLLVTALCRCLAEDGYRVAPFKAQNMSNNSGVAVDGGELGRAQIVQARACGIDADTRMNPVLLKPTSDLGSQVVVRGQVLGHRDVLGYFATRQLCLDAALDSYDSLAREFDVIVCEGAGSAGEMNLRSRDIVNMGFVERREMPVVLVGDIDRGGVYASFVGHLAVMSEADRARVRGFVVNRFRGDAALLEDAHHWVERHTGRPVLGVVPYLTDLRLPKEDRLSLQADRRHFGSKTAPLQIAVVVPPHVSNATDIDPLIEEADVQVQLVERVSELEQPDVVLLLGTKNTIGDLLQLRESGLERAIIDAHRAGAEIIGICGGLQMLGESIEDPAGIEATTTRVQGLGLLPIVTTYAATKLVRRIEARHVPSGTRVSGYEIHQGQTDFTRAARTIVDDEDLTLGVSSDDGQVWGTYVHGLFDSDQFRRWYLDRLRVRKGLGALGSARQSFSLDSAFQRLARVFREHVDYPAILRVMGL